MFKDGEDFYIKIDDKDEASLENNITDINFLNKKTEPQVDDIPHYNSPEYAEYISKISKEGLKEIASEEDIGIRSKIKEKYSNKKIQLSIFVLIVILFLAIIIVGSSMVKSVSNTSVSNNQSIELTNEGSKEFKFLIEVIALSGSDSVESYNTLKEFVTTKEKMGYEKYQNNIKSIKEKAQANLNDVNSLSSYIDVNNYKAIVACLKARYENTIELCDMLLDKNTSSAISTYNKYVLLEASIVDELNAAIVEKADNFNIDYEIEDGKIILHID